MSPFGREKEGNTSERPPKGFEGVEEEKLTPVRPWDSKYKGEKGVVVRWGKK